VSPLPNAAASNASFLTIIVPHPLCLNSHCLSTAGPRLARLQST
jgi:hypothetical protein